MKKKILMLAIAACLIVLSIAGSSLAYFTDTDAKTTTFTSGNVDITLSFAGPTGRMFPGMSYATPATITNTGSEEAYVGAIITVPTALKDVFKDYFADAEVRFVTAGNSCQIFVAKDAKLAKDASTTVFERIDIPATWGNTEMEVFNGLVGVNVNVIAYATQTVFAADSEIDTSLEALAAAFPNVWNVTFD